MKQQYIVKYQTKQGGSGASVTTTVMANSSAEARAAITKRVPGCKILSCTAK